MRVLHVAPYFAPAFCYGGPPRSILGLCQAERRSGVEVTVFTTTANGATELPAAVDAPASTEGVPVYRFPLGLAGRFFRAPQLAPALAARAGDFDLAHIHCLWNFAEWGAARACWQSGLPYVISTRGMLNHAARRHRYWRKKLMFPLIEARILRRAGFLHVTSSEEADEIRRMALACPVLQLPNGVDIPAGLDAQRGSFRRQYGIGQDSPIVVWIGRIHSIKRLDLLAAAFAIARRRLPGLKLVLAGPDEGGYRAQVAPLFAGFGEEVVWTGEVDSGMRSRLLADATLLVACSDVESFGMSIVEAMAAAVPVVVTRTCPWPQVESERCGRWISQDAESIAGAIVELASDPARARAMGGNGRRLVEARYAWSSVARDTIAAYAKVLEP